MGRYTKPLDLYKAQLKYFEEREVGMREGYKTIPEAGKADALELTSGTLSPEQTQGAFAREGGAKEGKRVQLSLGQLSRRGLKGAVPLLPVNQQSHDLHNSIQLKPAIQGRAMEAYDLTQENAGGGIYRIVPGGTEKLVDSGFFPELKRRWKARSRAFIDAFRAMSRKD